MVRGVTAWTSEMFDKWQEYLDWSAFEDTAATLLRDELSRLMEDANPKSKESKKIIRQYVRRINRHVRNSVRYNRKAERINKRYERFMSHANPRHARR